MKLKILLGLAPAAMLLIGTSYVWAADAKIDCSTASDDIVTLQGEKKSTSEKKAKGIFSFTPIGMIVNAASDDEKISADKKMHVDEYNEKLDAHIAKIKAACGDSLSSDSSSSY